MVSGVVKALRHCLNCSKAAGSSALTTLSLTIPMPSAGNRKWKMSVTAGVWVRGRARGAAARQSRSGKPFSPLPGLS
ncbi:hypothetical protein D3C78_1547280 [compost metagenome]